MHWYLAAPGIPTHELTNRVIELEALWGCVATNLMARVREAATSAGRLSLLGEFLIERMMLSGPSRMGLWLRQSRGDRFVQDVSDAVS
jgi:hypothetical protein